MVIHDHEKSDDQIQKDVLQELAWDTRLEGLDIAVEVHGHVVTLLGEVATWSQRMIAEAAARRVTGVLDVANGIQAKQAPTADLELAMELADADVTPEALRYAIRSALDRHTDREMGKLEIVVEAGRVTLHGRVQSWHEREAVIGAVMSTRGVKNVVDRLRIA